MSNIKFKLIDKKINFLYSKTLCKVLVRSVRIKNTKKNKNIFGLTKYKLKCSFG